jgi:hypothetical protein
VSARPDQPQVTQDEATTSLVRSLRDDVIPGAGRGLDVHVTGGAATNIDVTDHLSGRTPLFFAAVLGMSFVILMMVFRSLLVPLKAVVMNLASIGAAYGVVAAVFQWGGGSREEYDRTGDAVTSVADGLASTARVITAAAAIMVVVFGSFILESIREIKLFGLGLAIAVCIDATVVRMVVVPASMALLRERNWWMPKWLAQRLPRLLLEGRREQAPAVIRSDSNLIAPNDVRMESCGRRSGFVSTLNTPRFRSGARSGPSWLTWWRADSPASASTGLRSTSCSSMREPAQSSSAGTSTGTGRLSFSGRSTRMSAA